VRNGGWSKKWRNQILAERLQTRQHSDNAQTLHNCVVKFEGICNNFETPTSNNFFPKQVHYYCWYLLYVHCYINKYIILTMNGGYIAQWMNKKLDLVLKYSRLFCDECKILTLLIYISKKISVRIFDLTNH
jgi:hypothetical protein